ncbi:unnamed protein product [Prorocentrum cordatum]|uniref:Uncharacterized protein n=1 Tax=Prorocentrum cordatum TaxID=2364126 RepID=A0ABN9Y4Z5_9DINO|nr:unnamed protein product [Polarella glacialis]
MNAHLKLFCYLAVLADAYAEPGRAALADSVGEFSVKGSREGVRLSYQSTVEQRLGDLWTKVMPAFSRIVALRRNITEMKKLAWQFGLGPDAMWVRIVWLYDLSRWLTKHGLSSP